MREQGRNRRRRQLLRPAVPVFLAATLLLAGCGILPRQGEIPGTEPLPESLFTQAPAEERSADRRQQALEAAGRLLGAPYAYGGSSPSGFDCSGLVYYVFRQAGIDVPRTCREQYRQSRHIDLARLQPGDLLFFSISRRRIGHVGIYVAPGLFIHAPSKGKGVSYARLEEPYWRRRLIGAGRFP